MWQALRLMILAVRQKLVLCNGPEQILALQQHRVGSLVARAMARSPF